MDKQNKWTKRETDRFMDMVLDGRNLGDVASEFNILDLVGVRKRFKRIFYPKKPYHPWGQRKVRTGMQITELERMLIRRYHKFGIPVADVARMLQRTPDEICPDYWGLITFDRMKEIAISSDILLAHHYLFHCSKSPVISDQAYDHKKEEEIEFGSILDVLHAINSTDRRPVDYPAHIRSLAHYMLYKFMQNSGKWDNNKLPYSWTKR